MWLVQTGSGMRWFPTGNKNALRHGRYSAEAVAWRRRMGTLLRAIRTFRMQVPAVDVVDQRREFANGTMVA